MAYVGKEALTCAELSELVYQMPYQIRLRISAIVANAQVTFRTIPNRNSRVLVAVSNTTIYVVFRGTVFSSLRSWQANLSTNRRNWMNGKVHGGFLGILNYAIPFFRPILAQPGNRAKEIYFTGHSQGGAVAFLAAMDNSRPISTSRFFKSYTFGQPRTANAYFCRSAEARMGSSCSRVANRRDVVVGVPLVWQGYDHIRDFLHYDSIGVVFRRRQATRAGWFHASIGDHSVTKYVSSAQKNVGVTV
jgi:triacylglycerol lipase